MMLDYEALFSDEQAVTASAISEDVYDLGAGLGNVGAGQPVTFEVLVTEDFATLTSLEIQIVAADDAALTTNPVIVESSSDVLLAALTAGYRYAGTVNLHEHKRYIGFKYVVTGSDATAGKVTAFMNLDIHADYAYPANYTVQTN